jgi:hypothetical protein
MGHASLRGGPALSIGQLAMSQASIAVMPINRVPSPRCQTDRCRPIHTSVSRRRRSSPRRPPRWMVSPFLPFPVAVERDPETSRLGIILAHSPEVARRQEERYRGLVPGTGGGIGGGIGGGTGAAQGDFIRHTFLLQPVTK